MRWVEWLRIRLAPRPPPSDIPALIDEQNVKLEQVVKELSTQVKIIKIHRQKSRDTLTTLLDDTLKIFNQRKEK